MTHQSSSNNYDFLRNDEYNLIKDELQMENQHLLQQRKTMEQRYTPHHHRKNKKKRIHSDSLHQPKQSYSRGVNRPSSNQTNHGEVTDRIKRKVREVINLCQTIDKSEDYQLEEIISAERQILDYLEQYSPIKKSPTKKKKLSNGKMKKVGITPKKSIREEILDIGFKDLISDDVVEMIQQIEKKALLEIQSLRVDKIMLLKKLNKQTKGHNQEKRKRIVLQRKIAQLQRQLEKGGKKMRVETYSVNKQQGRKYQYQGQEIIEENEEQDGSESEDSHQNQEKEPQFQQQQRYPQHQSQHPQHQSQHPQHQSQHPQHQPQHLQHQSKNQQHQLIRKSSINQTKNSEQFMRSRFPQVSQAYSYVPQAPSHFRQAESTGVFGQDNQIQEQINKLQNQNEMLKQSLSNIAPNFYNPLKTQLKSELAGLQNQLRQYQTIIKNKSTGAGDDELQNLFRDSTQILSEGHKLMRVKSKPEFKTYNDESSHQQIAFLRSKLRDLKQENKSLHSGGQRFQTPTYNHKLNYSENFQKKYYQSQTPKSRNHVSGNYQSLIEQMRRANAR